MQVADLLPLELLTVIVAVPAEFAVTTPFDTLATFELLLVHVIPSLAVLGVFVTELLKSNFSPTFNVFDVGLTAKPLIDVVTVTEHCAIFSFCVVNFFVLCILTLPTFPKKDNIIK